MRAFPAGLSAGAVLLLATGALAQTPVKSALTTTTKKPTPHAAAASSKKSADFVAVLEGGYEVPAVASIASGSAEFTVRGADLHYVVHVAGLSDITAAHLHLGAADKTGAPVATLYAGPARGSGLIAEGTLHPKDLHGTTMSALLSAMRKGDVYVNVHTTAHPEGAIRGQVKLQT